MVSDEQLREEAQKDFRWVMKKYSSPVEVDDMLIMPPTVGIPDAIGRISRAARKGDCYDYLGTVADAYIALGRNIRAMETEPDMYPPEFMIEYRSDWGGLIWDYVLAGIRSGCRCSPGGGYDWP